MKFALFFCLFYVSSYAPVTLAAQPESPYAGQEARDIKSLSPEEINAYLSGKGMGFAKAAELNGYLGPAHVLELSAQLRLTPKQRSKTEALFNAMEAKASSLGSALVQEERKLDQLFAAKTIDSALLSSSLDKIGALQAQVRGTHLEAHLAQTKILTSEQTARYIQLRG